MHSASRKARLMFEGSRSGFCKSSFRPLRSFCVLAAFLGTLNLGTVWAQRLTVKSGVVLNGITVVDTRTGKLLPNQAVAIDGGKITHILPAGSIKSGGTARILELHGKFLVPGYLDMHVHVMDESESRTDDLALMLANGITGFRQMSGNPMLLEMRKEGKLTLPAEAPELLAMPGTILTRANAATPEQAVAEVDRQKAEGADFIKTIDVTPATFFAAEQEASKQGLPYAGHISPGVSETEASQQGMRSIEHLGPAEITLVDCSTAEAAVRQAMANAPKPVFPKLPPEQMAKVTRLMVANPTLGRILQDPAQPQRTQRLIDSFSEEKCGKLAAVFVANHTWEVPTLIRERTYQFGDDPQYTNDPNLKYVSAATRQFWAALGQQFTARVTPEDKATLKQLMALELKMTKLFDESGVPMMTGSDYGGIWVLPGFSLHQEFDLLGQAGLTPLKILQMTTLNGAKFLGRESTSGTVEEGKDANLVILDADPTVSVANLHALDGVVRGGTYYSRGALEALKKAVADRVAALPAAPPPPTAVP